MITLQQHAGQGFNPRARARRDGSPALSWKRYSSFNPRARARRDKMFSFFELNTQVSIHAPARGATPAAVVERPATAFQSTRPREARRLQRVTAAMASGFQSTRPREARLLVPCRNQPPAEFQSTRPREARRPARRSDPPGKNVSIHAPARGATQGRVFFMRHLKFQSTRPREARPAGKRDSTNRGCFNPRARARRDQARQGDPAPGNGFNPRARARRDPRWSDRVLTILEVSIHAPARGATPGPCVLHAAFEGFNPRARARRDNDHLRGDDMPASFNPRARARRDSMEMIARPIIEVSIHAPARGATIQRGDQFAAVEFQSTRPREARLKMPACHHTGSTFQSTRPREARPDLFISLAPQVYVSIHAPARGATTRSASFPAVGLSFNPRARARRDRSGMLEYYSVPKFQSTRPREARPRLSFAFIVDKKFQSTRPREARPPGCRQGGIFIMGFNPRARARRDCGYSMIMITQHIRVSYREHIYLHQ